MTAMIDHENDDRGGGGGGGLIGYSRPLCGTLRSDYFACKSIDVRREKLGFEVT